MALNAHSQRSRRKINDAEKSMITTRVNETADQNIPQRQSNIDQH